MLSCDSDTDIEDEFFTALALFKSTAISSEAKLRDLLLRTISKRKKFSNHDTKIPFPASIYENISDTSKMKMNSNIAEKLGNLKDIYCDLINEENQGESSEIPTISIPDEGFTDFITCKICDGAKIGPFILLECQDCSDTYHPLCHQPPVIDIDVYDPRLVWRCSRCTAICAEISPEISLALNSLNDNGNENIDAQENARKTAENTSVNTNSSMKMKKYSFTRDNTDERGTLKDTMKEEYYSMGNQYRKRIGSKLTVSRANTKT